MMLLIRFLQEMCMKRTKAQKNLIFFSETIFSDRICNQIIKKKSNYNVHVIFSNEVKEFDRKLKSRNRSLLFRLRVIIVRYLVELMRYVAPSEANDIALKDHFIINSASWKFYKKQSFKLYISALKYSHFLRKIIHKLILFLVPKSITSEIFSKILDFNIVVFSVGNLKSLSVVSFVANAKKFNNHTSYTFIQSWDNPTTKGYGAFRTDFFLTWTELMRFEIDLYQDIPLKKSLAVGSPTLLSQKYIESHKPPHVSPVKQKIIFATKSPASYKSNLDIAEALAIFSSEHDFELEVRMHPLCLVRKSDELENMIRLSKKYTFDVRYPELSKSNVVLDSIKDNLAFTSKQNDILVTIYSTMNIEAAYLGMRCINIDFATKEGKDFSPRVNIDLDRKQLHNKRILSYGYIYNTKSINHLLETITMITSGDLIASKEKERQTVMNKECSPVYDVDNLLKAIS